MSRNVTACLALSVALALGGCSGVRHVAVRDNVPGWITVGVGGLVAVTGALIGAHGAAMHGSPNCAAYPQTVQNCDEISRQMQGGGWSLLGLGAGAAISGGIVIGAQAHGTLPDAK
jgi:hypothetical protein